MKVTKILVLLILLGLVVMPFTYAEKEKDTTKAKAVIVYLNIKDGKVTLLGKKIIYGYPPEHFVQWKDFNVKIFSSQNALIEKYGIMDPRWRHWEDNKWELQKEADFSLIFPFSENLEKVTLNNYTSDEELISVPLVDEVKKFCEKNKDDPDCEKKFGAVGFKLPMEYTAIFLIVVLIAAVYFIFIKKKTAKKKKKK